MLSRINICISGNRVWTWNINNDYTNILKFRKKIFYFTPFNEHPLKGQSDPTDKALTQTHLHGYNEDHSTNTFHLPNHNTHYSVVSSCSSHLVNMLWHNKLKHFVVSNKKECILMLLWYYGPKSNHLYLIIVLNKSEQIHFDPLVAWITWPILPYKLTTQTSIRESSISAYSCTYLKSLSCEASSWQFVIFPLFVMKKRIH